MAGTPRPLHDLKPLLVGVINMQYTPFDGDEEIDEAALRANTRWMIEEGIVAGRGVQIVGAYAGQGHYLTMADYERLIPIVVEEAAGRVPIGVGCMASTTREVVRLAQYAERGGADFVLVPAPRLYPNQPCPPEVVWEHYQRVTGAVGIGVMVHNTPSTAGQNLSVEMLLRLAELPNVIALKEDRSDFGGLREVIHALKDRLMVNANSYKAMIPLDYLTGLTGHNSFLGNVDPAYALRLHDICLSGDFRQAHEFWARAVPLYAYLLGGTKYTLEELGKEMARLAGRPAGEGERRPLRRVGAPERARLRQLMLDVGMRVAAA